MSGFDVRIVDNSGKEVPKGQHGNIILVMPLAPIGFRTFWQGEERFWKGYLKRFDGIWIDTGDAGMIDDDGYIRIMSRPDDIIEVAAHRFSTGIFPAAFSCVYPPTSWGSNEQAITSHLTIAECCVVGIQDAVKGRLPFAFVTLNR